MIEIIELMVPGDVQRLYVVVHKKAAEWAVMDSDPRMNSGNVVNAMAVTKLELCKFYQKGLCKRGKDCRFSHEKGARQPPGKGGSKGKGGKAGKDKTRVPKDQCFNCGKVTDPPHRAAECPEKWRSAAAAAQTEQPQAKAQAQQVKPVAAKQDKLQELAKACFAELASGVGTDDLLKKLACPMVMASTRRLLENNEGIIMIADTGAEVHVVGKRDQGFLKNLRQRTPPCILDTANGQVVLHMEGEVECDGLVMSKCVYNPHVDFSLMSIVCMENVGWTYTQGGGKCRLEKGGERRDLTISGGLYLMGLSSQVLVAVEASTEIVITADDEVLLRVPKMLHVEPAVKANYERDGVSLTHLRAGHKPYDPQLHHLPNYEDENASTSTCTG